MYVDDILENDLKEINEDVESDKKEELYEKLLNQMLRFKNNFWSYVSQETNQLLQTVHMFSGKMLNWAELLKLAGRGLRGNSFPHSDPKTCI